jgi:hypothetical protein
VSLPVYRNLSLPYRERKKGPSRVHQPKEKKRIFSSLLVSVSLLFFYKKRVKSIRKKKKGPLRRDEDRTAEIKKLYTSRSSTAPKSREKKMAPSEDQHRIFLYSTIQKLYRHSRDAAGPGAMIPGHTVSTHVSKITLRLYIKEGEEEGAYMCVCVVPKRNSRGDRGTRNKQLHLFPSSSSFSFWVSLSYYSCAAAAAAGP